MISPEFMDQLQQLDHADKLTVIQFLAAELAIENDSVFQFGASYDVWSPFESPQAARVLLQMLEEEKNADG